MFSYGPGFGYGWGDPYGYGAFPGAFTGVLRSQL
jgi:hypothetical protein